MTDKEEFDCFIEQMHINAGQDFQKTEEYRLLREKMELMDANCETILNPSDRPFVTECFELILDKCGQQEFYVYRKGLTDCVNILKHLGVLA